MQPHQIIEFLEHKVKASEKIVQETIVESFPNLRKNTQSSPKSA